MPCFLSGIFLFDCVQFSSHAKTLQDALEYQTLSIVRTLSSLGDMIASEGRPNNQEHEHVTNNANTSNVPSSSTFYYDGFPFVTIKDFEIKGAHARLAASVEFIVYAPLVTAMPFPHQQQQRFSSWNTYSVQQASD